ncbi:DAK2 domain-containing protein [Alicyclobacillus curvatus]|nr:DAK2 domain-containing protein [Alicyclobacillus curvatus]
MSVDAFLDGSQFVDMFRAGHESLKQRVAVVNGLNVFPVPDGDTGTNMELSLAAGLRSMDVVKGRGLRAILESLSTGLLMGARGNSGVILSQLLRGFTRIQVSGEFLDVALFSQALSEGVQIAYQAVAKPVEGTILTVAREAAAAGKKAARTESSFGPWLSTVVEAAQSALDKTPQLLPVLRNAGVVDSGGQGLVFMLEGFRDFAHGVDVSERTSPQNREVADMPQLHLGDIHHDGEYGYCTEVLIRAENQSVTAVERALREQLGQYGDSLLVVGAEPLVKVHVHTLHPGRVMEDALQYGPLVKIKVDNMTEQFETAHGATSNHGHLEQTDAVVEYTNGVVEQTDATLKGTDSGDVGVVAEGPALVAVAAGDGIVRTLSSIGVDKVVEGGQTMNPSTEDIVQAVRTALAQTHKQTAIILPNNKNIIMAAEQARQVLGDHVYVVATVDIPQGMAAALAFLPGRDLDENISRMQKAAQSTVSGQIVRAVRDSVYEDIEIQKGEYLVFVRGSLKAAYASAKEAIHGAVEAMWSPSAELLTVLYGQSLDPDEVDDVLTVVGDWPDLEIEVQPGGQPVYDYILALE